LVWCFPGKRTGVFNSDPLYGVDGGQEHRPDGRRVRQEHAQYTGQMSK